MLREPRKRHIVSKHLGRKATFQLAFGENKIIGQMLENKGEKDNIITYPDRDNLANKLKHIKASMLLGMVPSRKAGQEALQYVIVYGADCLICVKSSLAENGLEKEAKFGRL